MMKLENCPHCGGDLRMFSGDARQTPFKVRVRLYDTRSASHDDPIADSAEGYAVDEPGPDIVCGIATAINEAMALAHDFHGRALTGWDEDTRKRKDRGIRPTLSRTGGRGRISIEYDTPESFTDGRMPPRFTCRIDLLRIEKPQIGAARHEH